MSANLYKVLAAFVIAALVFTAESIPQMGYYPHLGMNHDMRQAWMEHQAKPAVELSKCKVSTIAGSLVGGAVGGIAGGPAGAAIGAISAALGGCVSERMVETVENADGTTAAPAA